MYQGEHCLAAIVYRISAMPGGSIDAPSISKDGRAFLLHRARTYEPDTVINSIIVLCFLICIVWGIHRFARQKKTTGRRYGALRGVA